MLCACVYMRCICIHDPQPMRHQPGSRSLPLCVRGSRRSPACGTYPWMISITHGAPAQQAPRARGACARVDDTHNPWGTSPAGTACAYIIHPHHTIHMSIHACMNTSTCAPHASYICIIPCIHLHRTIHICVYEYICIFGLCVCACLHAYMCPHADRMRHTSASYHAYMRAWGICHYYAYMGCVHVCVHVCVHACGAHTQYSTMELT